MKKLTNFLLPVEIGMDLDEVESIRFKFQQFQKSLIFDYPSDLATRKEGQNIILLRWKPEDTMMFEHNRILELDTFIRIKGSEMNPWTEIVSTKMHRTLFYPEEVGIDD